MSDELWLEFTVGNLCGLCGNYGTIDTRGIQSPAGLDCGAEHFCICPNGRSLKLRFVLVEDVPPRWRGSRQALRSALALKDKALEPFAKLGRAIDDPRSPDVKRGKPAKDESIFAGQALYGADGSVEHNPITFGDLRRASQALSTSTTGEIDGDAQ